MHFFGRKRAVLISAALVAGSLGLGGVALAPSASASMLCYKQTGSSVYSGVTVRNWALVTISSGSCQSHGYITTAARDKTYFQQLNDVANASAEANIDSCNSGGTVCDRGSTPPATSSGTTSSGSRSSGTSTGSNTSSSSSSSSMNTAPAIAASCSSKAGNTTVSHFGKTLKVDCDNFANAPIYAGTTQSTKVVGHIESTKSWYVCYSVHGTNPKLGSGTNNSWLYTYDTDNKVWGWVPATYIKQGDNNKPVPGVPACGSVKKVA